MAKTDIFATPPIIAGFTNPEEFDKAYTASRPGPVRAVINAFTASQITPEQRKAQMQQLALQGFLIDPEIDAQYNAGGTPWQVTTSRLQYSGVGTQIPALNGMGMLPVPPDLTPARDMIKQNEWVGLLWRTRMDYILNSHVDPANGLPFAPGIGDVYLMAKDGRAPGMPGSTIVETNGDGFTYQVRGQIASGDYAINYVRVPAGTPNTAQQGLIPLP